MIEDSSGEMFGRRAAAPDVTGVHMRALSLIPLWNKTQARVSGRITNRVLCGGEDPWVALFTLVLYL
jgi:hypothetical protein